MHKFLCEVSNVSGVMLYTYKSLFVELIGLGICCGIGLPVFKVRLEYGAERPIVLLIESEEKARAVVDMICRANPDITLEYYRDPHTGLRPEKVSPPLY